MRLSAKALTNYNSANSFLYTSQWNVRAGDPNTLYFQLVDLDQISSVPAIGQSLLGASGVIASPGTRYLAGLGVSNQPASINVIFPSIDDAKVLTIAAIQDPADSSIWSIDLTALQTPGSGNVQFAVTEGTKTRTFSVLGLMSVEYANDGSDSITPNSYYNY